MQVVLAALFLSQDTAWEVSVDVVIKAPPQEVFKFILYHGAGSMSLMIAFTFLLGSG